MNDTHASALAALRSAHAAASASEGDPLATFAERARAHGAVIYDVPAGEDHATVVGEILASLDATKIAVSRDGTAREVCMFFGCATVSGATDAGQLEGCAAGVTMAEAAVAETGAVVFRADGEDHRVTALGAPVAVVMLPRAALAATLEEGLPAGGDGRVLLVGPEAPPVPGGPAMLQPRELHILLLDGPADGPADGPVG